MEASTDRPAPLLTPKELCAQLSISPMTYFRLVRAGLPCLCVLTARRYDLAEVTAWLRIRTATPVAPPRSALRIRPDDGQFLHHLALLAQAGGARKWRGRR